MSVDDEPTSVTVVVPTFNRRDRLERVLRSLAAQDVRDPFEVIVVSDGSTDGTDDYLRSDTVPLPVLALSQPNQGPSAARNLGVESASGQLVVFIDDDVVAERSLLRAHLEAHRRLGDKTVVIGPMLNPTDHAMSPWISWEQEMLTKQYDAMNQGVYAATARQFYTGNASVRREHVVAVGGFDTSFRRAEDVELAYRLDDRGLRFHFEPTAVGYHYAERSYDAWRNTAYTYGRNDIVFARDRGRTWIFGFVSDGFGRHHPALRWLAWRCVRSDAWRTRSIRMLERVIGVASRLRLGRVARYALSGVYAIEYHRGLADELGSPTAFDHVVRHGTSPAAAA